MTYVCTFAMFALLAVSAPACGKPGSQNRDQTTQAAPSGAAAGNAAPRAPGDGELPMLDFANARRAHGFLVGGALTPEHVAEAGQKGYKRIIDLRLPNEAGVAQERAKAEELGISYISLPVGGQDDLSEDNAKKLGELIDDDAGPTIIHCKSGNRVGALLALHAFYVAKQPAEDALAIGLEAGLTRLEPAVREALGL
jgi:uncharacterized protein (TIGR01244 family)